MRERVVVSSPGKVMLLGEWSVLVPGHPCVVAAINERFSIDVLWNSEPEVVFSVPELNIDEVRFVWRDGELLPEAGVGESTVAQLRFIRRATVMSCHAIGVRPGLRIGSLSTGCGITMPLGSKYGFGSSAAVTVGTCGGVFALYGERIEDAQVRERLFKLAALAHYLEQGRVGSGFDIAASVFGGVIRYTRFLPSAVPSELSPGVLRDLLDRSWPGVSVEGLPWPEEAQLLVGYTGESASTVELIKRFSYCQERDSSSYREFLREVSAAVESSCAACRAAETSKLMDSIRRNRLALSQLTHESGVPIETPQLRRLAELAEAAGGAGKLSGAGGGDCGIAVTRGCEVAEAVRAAWRLEGILPLGVRIDFRGVSEEGERG